MIIPSHFKPQYSAQAIEEQVSRLGSDISVWAEQVWESSHSDLLTIPVLRGGIFFFADLVRHIQPSVEMAPARTWVYESTSNAVLRDEVKVDLEHVPAKGRSVLLIDDICDSGKTLHVLSQALRDIGAIEVRSAVLIQRIVEDQLFTPDWVGFEYHGSEWFVGYGMEDSNRWRNLPDIYIIQQLED